MTMMKFKASKTLGLLSFLALAGIGLFGALLLNSSDNISPTDSSASSNVCGNGVINRGEDCDNGVHPSCNKIGENFATQAHEISDLSGSLQRIQELNMGYALTLSVFPDSFSSNSTGDVFFDIIDGTNKATTPVLRICTYDLCVGQDAATSFKNPSVYVDFLESVAARIESRLGNNDFEFYAIAGPNEPLNEPWLAGLEGISPGIYTSEHLTLIGRENAEYMNSVISGIDTSSYSHNIKLLSPAFNTTHPQFEDFVSEMNSNGAKFKSLDAIAGNAYNLNGYSVDGVSYETITSFVQRMKKAGFSRRSIFITETGMYESEKNPLWTNTVSHSIAKLNLKNELELLRNDSKIVGYLMFNSFGNNPDSNFDYNEISDAEYSGEILNEACLKEADPQCVDCQLVTESDCDSWEFGKICGVDGVTYTNSCYAGVEGVEVDCRGACPCDEEHTR